MLLFFPYLKESKMINFLLDMKRKIILGEIQKVRSSKIFISQPLSPVLVHLRFRLTPFPFPMYVHFEKFFWTLPPSSLFWGRRFGIHLS